MTETQTLPATEPAVAVRPRLGFAGVGWIGRHRMEAIAQSGWGEVAAIFDPHVDAATKAGELIPEASRAASFDELLEQELDGIVIATPNALHAEQAVAALRRGRAVFCQKPLGRDAAETRAVIAAAREADRLLHVDLSYRFTEGMRRIRELVRNGELGRVYAIEAVFHNAYGPDKPWFYDAKLSGGGCLLDLGVHLVDLALWCLDFPEVSNVVGHLLNRAPTAPEKSHRVEDYAAAQLLLANSASMQLACSWKAPAGCDADIRLSFFGSEGGAEFANVNGSFFDFTAEQFLPDRSRRALATPPRSRGDRVVQAARRIRRFRS
jgi:predicted dehydrogenase